MQLQGWFAGATDSINPARQGVTVSLADEDGEIMCLTIPPGEGWTTNKRRTVWTFREWRYHHHPKNWPDAPKKFRLQLFPKINKYNVQVHLDDVEVIDAEAGKVRTGISFGEQGFVNQQQWRSKARDKKLVTP